MFTRVQARFVGVPVRFGRCRKRGCSGYAVVPKESSEEPQYPTIVPIDWESTGKRKKAEWYEEIRKVKTVEEKLFKINMPWYYGWRSVLIEENDMKNESLPFAQFATRTHMMPAGTLPSCYATEFDESFVKQVIERIKPLIKEAFLFELGNIPKDTREENLDYVRRLTYQLNRLIMSETSLTCPHLLIADVDFEPRLESFWMVGSTDSPINMKKWRASMKTLPYGDKFIYQKIDMPVQYLGSPLLHLRSQNPLKEFVSSEEMASMETHVPLYQHDPRRLGYFFHHRHATTIPGYWPRPAPYFGTLSFNSTSHLLHPPPCAQPYPDAVKVQAIFNSFAWLQAQACYQGFTTFQEITYPLTSQMVLTNGAEFYFCAYQLNTTLLHTDHSVTNPKANLCWLSEPMELFELDADNSLKDINDKVLETMIKFYINAPAKREGVEMQPYLGQSEKRIADIEEDERRAWLEKHYKHLMTNRPRHKLSPEIYQWERFYIINNNQRHRTRNREYPREKNLNRRLDDHLPEYVPKCLRENPKKKQIGRFAKTYYP